ncbi:hypothetical protein BKA62DRAFT_835533 [Auriculariales sp. MPI-PUGE-AT-0066]|nr:hypothetical protein BKA62DRAFT_835533 [Auriculariales sp. MPI-PUGE-AT-0066]
MGPGGIGKTSLALAVLYDQRVIDAVGEHRFFVSMEALIDIDTLYQAAIAHLASLQHPLLVIDNLETLWFANNASARNDTETFLSRLAQIPSLTLIVTSRGAIPPGGVQWSNKQSAELATLSLDAARNTFIQIATLPSEPTEKAALDTLLGEIDYVPLAVTLISRLALLKNSPSELLRRWQERRTQLLCEQGDDRLRSVDVSITVSLDLLQGMRHGAESMQLLAVCAHLADGLRRPVFLQLQEHFSNIDAARDLLIEFALVAAGDAGSSRC